MCVKYDKIVGFGFYCVVFVHWNSASVPELRHWQELRHWVHGAIWDLKNGDRIRGWFLYMWCGA